MDVKKIFTKYKMLIPTLILTYFCMHIIFVAIRGTAELGGFTYLFSMSIQQKAALAAVALNWTAFFLLRPSYKYVFLVTVLLGLFSMLVFTPQSIRYSISLGSAELTFQPSALLAGFIAFLLYIRKPFKANTEAAEKNAVYNENKFAEELSHFKEAYKSKSSESLEKILIEKRYTAAALEAANQILEERNKVSGI